ncbi:ankyrin repeat domain-containing protein [Sphingobacterium pedocola]|nr:ankyrin repeat domain-containing protein [Sphingobacterium pedocola]
MIAMASIFKKNSTHKIMCLFVALIASSYATAQLKDSDKAHFVDTATFRGPFYINFLNTTVAEYVERLKKTDIEGTAVAINLLSLVNQAPSRWIQKKELAYLMKLIDSEEPAKCAVSVLASTLPLKDSATIGGHAMDLIDAYRLGKKYPAFLTSCPKTDSVRKAEIKTWWEAKFSNQKQIAMNTAEIIKLVETNDLTAVQKALENRVNVNTTDNSQRSLLLIATNNRLVDMAELLVAHGADVNQQADNKDSPFLYAGASGQTELVQLYLENGAKFNVFNRYHGSALIPACERGHVETVRLLANTKNYPIDHINRLGWTALLEAVILGDGGATYQEIVQILKDAGAKLDIPDHDGVTSLQHAHRKGFTAIAKLLQ